MIFTTGPEERFNRFFQNYGRPTMVGRVGARVWETEEEARKHCPEGYKVYGLFADWKTDTAPAEGGDGHELIVNAELVQLSSVI